MAVEGRPADRAGLEDVEGLVFDLQRYSLHDGPGLRTNVFLKGCPLRCRWCCNPESQRAEPELAFFEGRCFGCGDCLAVCRQGALQLVDGGPRWDPALCDECGRCVVACASGAIQWIGYRMSAGEVLEEALRDSAFYHSEGGITLTGGEPLLQPEFAAAILRLARGEYLHTTLETCGQAPWPVFEQVLPYVDLVLYDLKHMDSGPHRQGTGAGNALILENARRVATSGTEMIVRFPLIPGFNMDMENVGRTMEFARRPGVGEIHLLPYHRLGRPKYQALGRDYPGEEFCLPQDGEVEAIACLARSWGLVAQVGG